MNKHTEIELKLRCTAEHAWQDIMQAPLLTQMAVPGSQIKQLLDARYFDTALGCLQKAQLAYRIRWENQQWIATVKGYGSATATGLHERQEWNVGVETPEPNIDVFQMLEVGQQLKMAVGEQLLIPIVMTRFERQTLDVVMKDGSVIEVAADRGEIIAGEKTAAILEVELELKAGEASALFTLGEALMKEYPLTPEVDSKFYRGLKLAGIAK